MRFVLLSGGKGKRLWPISTDNMPKQFVHLINKSDSMLKITYDSVSRIANKKNIYISTGREYEDEVRKELDNFSNFIIEPAFVGTFGAILNVAVYLKEVEKISDDEVVSIIPIDHDVDDKFYQAILEAEKMINSKKSDICLIGIEPSFPSTQYGYIIENNNYVQEFREKPTIDDALILLENSALWNSGIVNFKLKKIVGIAKKYINYDSYNDFINKYIELPHISFDYEVLEKEKDLLVIRSNSRWADIGTLDVLASKISEPDKYNTNIINFEDKKIINDGICDAIVVNCKSGLKLVKKAFNDLVFRSWGYYNIIYDFSSDFFKIKVKELTILPGKNISYQYHKYRYEKWFVISGSGEVIIEKNHRIITVGDIVTVSKKKKHSIRALDKLKIIEVQYSDVMVDEADIVRIEYDWNKII